MINPDNTGVLREEVYTFRGVSSTTNKQRGMNVCFVLFLVSSLDFWLLCAFIHQKGVQVSSHLSRTQIDSVSIQILCTLYEHKQFLQDPTLWSLDSEFKPQSFFLPTKMLTMCDPCEAWTVTLNLSVSGSYQTPQGLVRQPTQPIWTQYLRGHLLSVRRAL